MDAYTDYIGMSNKERILRKALDGTSLKVSPESQTAIDMNEMADQGLITFTITDHYGIDVYTPILTKQGKLFLIYLDL